MTQTATRTIRAGDAVRHLKSGQEWLVAGVDRNGAIYPAGWPDGRIDAAEFELLTACSDEQHTGMLLQCARMSGADSRKSLAIEEFTRRMGRGEQIPPDIAGVIIERLATEASRLRQQAEIVHRMTLKAVGLWPGRPRWLAVDVAKGIDRAQKDTQSAGETARAIDALLARALVPATNP